MSEQDKIKQAVDETIAEMNRKIEELSKLKNDENMDSKTKKKIESAVDDAVSYLNEGIDYLKKHYNEVKDSNQVQDTLDSIKNMSKDIFNAVHNKIQEVVNDPSLAMKFDNLGHSIRAQAQRTEDMMNDGIDHIKNNDDFNKMADKVNEGVDYIKNNRDINNFVDKLNEHTDNFLYSARDFYDEVTVNPQVIDAIDKAKEVGRDIGDKTKVVINNIFDKKD